MYKLGEKEVFIPWIQFDVSYSYSFVRDLNVFEWLIIECLNQTFLDKKELSLKEIAKLAGLDERGTEFLKPFITNLCLNKTLKSSNLISHISDDLSNYTCSENGLFLFNKGKTYIRENNGSIRVFYSPIISDFIKERELSFQKVEPGNILYLNRDKEFFSDLIANSTSQHLGYFPYLEVLDQTKLAEIITELNIFPKEQEISISPSILPKDPELKWEKRTVSVGINPEGKLCAEIKYKDNNFNVKLSELLRQGEICENFLKITRIQPVEIRQFEKMENKSNFTRNPVLLQDWLLHSHQCYLKSDITEQIKTRFQNVPIKQFFCTNFELEPISDFLLCPVMIRIAKGNESASTFSIKKIQEKSYVFLDLFLSNFTLPILKIVNNTWFEEGNVRIQENQIHQTNPENPENEVNASYQSIELIKEYDKDPELFYSEYNLTQEIKNVGVKLASSLVMDSENKIAVLVNWNKFFRNFFDQSKEITKIINSYLNSIPTLSPIQLESIILWIQEIDKNDIGAILEQLLRIKQKTPIQTRPFLDELTFKNKIERIFKEMIQVFEPLWLQYFLPYFPILQLNSSNNDGKKPELLNKKDLLEIVNQIDRLNISSLNVAIQSYLITQNFETKNVREFLETLKIFDQCHPPISPELKDYAQRYILDNLSYLIDLKLRVYFGSDKKRAHDENKLLFIQILGIITRLKLDLPKYSVFEKLLVKNEQSSLDKLKQQYSPKIPKPDTQNITEDNAQNVSDNTKLKSAQILPQNIIPEIKFDGTQDSQLNHMDFDSTEPKPFIIDGRVSDLNDIYKCRDKLQLDGIPLKEIYVILGTSHFYNLLDHNQKKIFDDLIKENNVNLAPEDQNDDWYIINLAMKLDGIILSNHEFAEFKQKDPNIMNYLQENTKKYHILENQIYFE